MTSFSQNQWTLESYTFLKSIIPESKGIAAFDFDNTMIKNDFGEAVMNSILQDGIHQLKENFTSFFQNKEKAKTIYTNRFNHTKELSKFVLDEYEYLIQIHGYEFAYRWSSFIFSGWTELDLKKYSRNVWNQEINSKLKNSVRPFIEIKELIQFMLGHNWTVYIVTASPQWIIEEISMEFGIRPEFVLGMVTNVKDGFNTSQIVEPYTYGEGKVSMLYQKIERNPDLAFGDSMNDYPLLKSAILKGFVLDKGNKELLEKANIHNFMIQPHFS